jgi:transcriptional regulator of acetoin/glycerol metabolism
VCSSPTPGQATFASFGTFSNAPCCSAKGAPDGGGSGPLTLEDAERHHIERILERTGGKVEEAAKLLDLSRSALYAKLKKYGLKPLGD